jgi:hypothetical protein
VLALDELVGRPVGQAGVQPDVLLLKVTDQEKLFQLTYSYYLMPVLKSGHKNPKNNNNPNSKDKL